MFVTTVRGGAIWWMRTKVKGRHGVICGLNCVIHVWAPWGRDACYLGRYINPRTFTFNWVKLPIDNVSMSVGHLDHVLLTVYSSMEHVTWNHHNVAELVGSCVPIHGWQPSQTMLWKRTTSSTETRQKWSIERLTKSPTFPGFPYKWSPWYLLLLLRAHETNLWVRHRCRGAIFVQYFTAAHLSSEVHFGNISLGVCAA